MEAVAINAINTLWFGMGANFFGRKPFGAAKLLRPDLKLSSPEMKIVPHSMVFLGGFNLAMALLSGLRTLEYFRRSKSGEAVFSSVEEVHITLSIALAHFTQFFCNIRHLKGLEGGAPWDVLKGTMLFIFITDLTCALLNVVLLRKAAALLTSLRKKQ